MKLCLISDTHNDHLGLTDRKWLPKADMIIHAGDISGMGRQHEIDNFFKWFGSLDYRYKIIIAGNHDFLFETHNSLSRTYIPENVIYLESSSVEIEGLKIYGEPRQPFFYNWAFNIQRGYLKKYWDAVPNDCDILISHGPPSHCGYLGMTLEGQEVGDTELAERIGELKNLLINVNGHIHEGRGDFTNANGTVIINASVLNRSYNLVNKPYLIEIDENKKVTILDK